MDDYKKINNLHLKNPFLKGVNKFNKHPSLIKSHKVYILGLVIVIFINISLFHENKENY